MSSRNPSRASDSSLLCLRGLRLGPAAEGPFLVNGLDLDLKPAEILGVLGDSGSGKTLSALAIMGLLPRGLSVWDGDLAVDDETLPLGGQTGRPAAGSTRRQLAMIFQEPRAALNPLFSIGFQIAEALRLDGLRGRALRSRGLELLRLVALPDPESRWKAFPHELSGGQCQRVVLAMALAGNPRLLIADEPTTALDVSVQAQVLALLDGLRQELGLAVMLITHDLAVVAAICDRLVVMEKGRAVETGTVEEVFRDPQATATRRLLRADRPPVNSAPSRVVTPGQLL